MYLVTQPGHEPFITPYFDAQHHWVDGMVVYRYAVGLYMDDGKTWKRINLDRL